MWMTLLSKVDAIKAIDTSTKVNYINWFVGIINDYRDMRRNRTHTPAPLTKLGSTMVKFKWSDIKKISI